MANYYTFEDVIKQLKLDDDELKRMISEGELTAYREQNEVRFRKEDIDAFGGKTGSTTQVSQPKYVLDEELVREYGRPEEPPTEQPIDFEGESEQVEQLEPLPEVSIEEFTYAEKMGKTTPVQTEPDNEPFVLEETGDVESDIGSTTLAEATDIEAGATMPFEVTEIDVESTEVTAESTQVTEEFTQPLTRDRKRRRQKYLLTPEEQRLIERKKPSFIWSVLLFLVLIPTAYTGVILYETLRMQTGKITQPTKMTTGIVDWVLDQYWQNQDWLKYHEKDVPKVPPDDVMKRYHRKIEGKSYKEPDKPKEPTEPTEPPK